MIVVDVPFSLPFNVAQIFWMTHFILGGARVAKNQFEQAHSCWLDVKYIYKKLSLIGLIEVWWRVDWKSNHTIRVNANPTIKRWIPYDLIVHTSKLSLNWRRYFNIKFLFVLTKLCLYCVNLIQGRSLGHWGWSSGWAIDLKVVVLSLIRSSLV